MPPPTHRGPVSNNPTAKYNALERTNCNLRIPLWQLVRGSTAAPTYFPPEVVKVGEDEFIFVDGGVTMYKQPRLSTLPYGHYRSVQSRLARR